MKNEFEINKRLAELLGYGVNGEYGFIDTSDDIVCRMIGVGQDGVYSHKNAVRLNFCKRPNDIWPVIFNLRISVEPISHGAWRISDAWGLHAKSTSVPLRGAALVAIKILESRL